MKLWKMFINEKTVNFGSTECTPKKEKNLRLADYDFYIEQVHSPDDPAIKPIINAGIEMYSNLRFNLKGETLHIVRGFERVTVWDTQELFTICFEDGLSKVHTTSSNAFTRKQFNAIFDFVDVLIKYEWFF